MPSADLSPTLDPIIAALVARLGDNLFSLCVYGSAVRGDFVGGSSNLNVLIVLHRSDAPAQDGVADALKSFPNVDPFILGRPGLERSVRAFAAKFASIKRNYRILAGADPLRGIEIEPPLERFLCEQALRNLRLRLVYSYTTRARHRAYVRFLSRSVTALFLRLSETLRLDGTDLSGNFEDRVGGLSRGLEISEDALCELLELKRGNSFREEDAATWHERVLPLLDTVLQRIEQRWPEALFPSRS